MTKPPSNKGAKLAAEILARMKPENQERVLREMAEQEKQNTVPDSGAGSSADLKELALFSTDSVRALCEALPHFDLLLVLLGASEAVKHTILVALPVEQRKAVEAELESRPPFEPAAIARARRRARAVVVELARAGKIVVQKSKR